MRRIRCFYGPRTLTDLARRWKPGRNRLPRIWLLTDATRLSDPRAVIMQLPRGAGVIFRHYEASNRASLAGEVARLCRARGLTLLVAGDAGLATRIRANGLHLPEALAGKARGWRRRRPHWLITAAAHSAAALSRVRAIDAVLLSPVFPTSSHPGSRPLGVLAFARLASRSRSPVLALGGISGTNVHRLTGINIAGVAAIAGLAKALPRIDRRP